MARLQEPGGGGTTATYVDGGLWANNPGLIGSSGPDSRHFRKTYLHGFFNQEPVVITIIDDQYFGLAEISLNSGLIAFTFHTFEGRY
ncbi:MAG: hypothetical protein EOO88_43360 [Pedobacter sp.]|nr:MAG: hypothetical protein EOO88_43360 [Pedobacter sp.]